MARKPLVGPTPVEAIKHQDTRTNIPTADAYEFVDPESNRPKTVVYERDSSLDPQLVWRGKDAHDSSDLMVDAPPIYIQEKINPLVLVENLRRTAPRPEDEPELSLFEQFDGLDELSQIEFYRHQASWSNRMILGDSLNVMASLAEREALRGKVQMVYLDPPYGIKFGSNWQVSARKRDVTDGKLEDAAREAEQIRAFRDTWELGIHSYLSYLRDRLMAARDLLTDSGSCFVQIGDENVHLVRSLMDEVFGSENFVSQIVFTKTITQTSTLLPAVFDHILWFGRSARPKYRALFNLKRAGELGATRYGFVELASGARRRMTAEEKADPLGLPSGSRIFTTGDLTSQEYRPDTSVAFSFEGRSFLPGADRHWNLSISGMQRLAKIGRITVEGSNIRAVRFLDDDPSFGISNMWTDTMGIQSRTDPRVYVVQTATKVVERCMLMCTDPGDLILDPTCGSGTTAFVAEQWGRRWLTIDTSRVALALARQRLMGAKFPYYLLADSMAGKAKEAELVRKPVQPGPVTDDIRYGFVYERVQHITLKSIANNPDIVEGMSRGEIDAAIKRHADFEYLYDKPHEDKKQVRVAGPFTVESLSPYRSVAFGGGVDEAHRETMSEEAAATDPEAVNFEQTILDNLAKAGIQNGRRNERIEFASINPYAGEYIQAVGERNTAAEGSDEGRVGLAVGPQYGTVGPAFIKDAAREAIRAGDIDLLCVLAFAFDPNAAGVTEDDGISVEASDVGFANVAGQRRLGRIQVLFVRMNADLLMGEELMKTASANLFTVFGEPDIELRRTDDEKIVVDLRGVDVYDPTRSQIRSNDTGQIALWMIDTDYDETSFFVRHCYFTGGNDPYNRLKVALKADIDAQAWESLYRTESLPFAPPASGRIAVKVINDYGDEVMKVFQV